MRLNELTIANIDKKEEYWQRQNRSWNCTNIFNYKIPHLNVCDYYTLDKIKIKLYIIAHNFYYKC